MIRDFLIVIKPNVCLCLFGFWLVCLVMYLFGLSCYNHRRPDRCFVTSWFNVCSCKPHSSSYLYCDGSDAYSAHIGLMRILQYKISIIQLKHQIYIYIYWSVGYKLTRISRMISIILIFIDSFWLPRQTLQYMTRYDYVRYCRSVNNTIFIQSGNIHHPSCYFYGHS